MNTTASTKKTPELILDTAQALMLYKGFHGVSVDTIIEKSGVSKGTFFYHFKSKDILAERLLIRFTEYIGSVIREEMEAAKNESTNAFETLIAFLARFPLRASAINGCLMASFSYQLLEESPKLESACREALQGWVRYFTPHIEEAFNERNSCVSDQAVEIAEMLFCLVEGSFIVCRIGKADTLQTQFKHLSNYIQLLASGNGP